MKDVCWVSESVDATPLSLAAYELVPPVEIIALPGQGVNNHNVSVRTGSGDFVVKTYTSNDDPASIHYEHRLLNWLAEAGLSFAVPVPIHTPGSASLCGGPFGWTSLSLRLPGSHLDPHRQDHVELLGAATGELQAALRHYPTTPRPGRPLFSTLFGFPLPFRSPFILAPNHLGLPDAPPYNSLLRWWREEAAQVKAFVEGPYGALPWQVCHNDVTPTNVLVEAGRVTAVLDFEFAAPAARALDVAMGLRMTMRIWEDPEP
jgi:homoserine kinase type II